MDLQDPTVEVIWIPSTGSSPKLVSVPLLSDEDLGPFTNLSNEQYLSSIPDLTEYCGPNFWKNYSLVDLAHLDPDENLGGIPPEEVLGPYLIYRCSTTKAELARNENFKRVPGAASVYGDAFVFKVKKPTEWITQITVAYDSLGESFITDAFKGKGIASDECLKWLSE